MQRYIGLDVHAMSSSFAVVSESGKRLKADVVQTAPQPLIQFVKCIRGHCHLCLEEGTQSSWIYEILKPHVDTIVVTHKSEHKGALKNKNDLSDAYQLADALRTGMIQPVFKEQGSLSRLRTLVSIYQMTSVDTVRVQNRLKALFRSRGVKTAGRTIYSVKHRDSWLCKLPHRYHTSAKLLFEQYDCMRTSKKNAQKHLVQELHRHGISHILESCPGFGEIRTAQFMSIVLSPYRFRTKRQLWSYAGLSIIMRSSSDYIQTAHGWQRTQVMHSRGLTRSYNRTLKNVLKGAATTVIDQRQEPLYGIYCRMLDNGIKPPLAKLTLARKIASIALVLWKKKEVYNPDYEMDKG
jgi:transposase